MTTRPRAADDFTTIRARIEELRYVTRPRAADDFTAIKARMGELRREREQLLSNQKGHSAIGPRPYHRALSSETEDQPERLWSRSVRRSFLR